MKKFDIRLIPGDGIGKEVINEGKKILETISDIHGGLKFEFREYNWSCEYYSENGSMMPADGIKILRDCDSILLGAVGFPGVPDHISLRELLLPIRQEFEQYINLRPIKLLDGLKSPLDIEKTSDIDFVVIRENSEGEYCGRGHFENEGTEDEAVVQEAVFTKKGTERVIKYAFEYAKSNGRTKVASATKSNALNYSMVFWDKIFNNIKNSYPNIESRSIHIDAMAGFFIMKPWMFEVVTASNLFGDILTDLGSAMLGSIGISPSANINPEKKFPSMFEPVHGSAPDIAGQGKANPTGTVWSIVLMLDHLGLENAAKLLMSALESVIRKGKFVTGDIGGSATTAEMCRAIVKRIKENVD